jgi:hypothetical protein
MHIAHLQLCQGPLGNICHMYDALNDRKHQAAEKYLGLVQNVLSIKITIRFSEKYKYYKMNYLTRISQFLLFS